MRVCDVLVVFLVVVLFAVCIQARKLRVRPASLVAPTCVLRVDGWGLTATYIRVRFVSHGMTRGAFEHVAEKITKYIRFFNISLPK